MNIVSFIVVLKYVFCSVGSRSELNPVPTDFSYFRQYNTAVTCRFSAEL